MPRLTSVDGNRLPTDRCRSPNRLRQLFKSSLATILSKPSHVKLGHYHRAVDLYRQALKLFQNANADASIMQTCNLLGVVELDAGRLAEARGWSERSREIAQRWGDIQVLGATAQNIGIVCQLEGEADRQRGDEATAQQRFADAERFLQESLQMNIDQQDKSGEASSRGQLSRVYLFMGELDTAEAHAHQARKIDEGLGMIRKLLRDYQNLAQTARARRRYAGGPGGGQARRGGGGTGPSCPRRRCSQREPAPADGPGHHSSCRGLRAGRPGRHWVAIRGRVRCGAAQIGEYRSIAAAGPLSPPPCHRTGERHSGRPGNTSCRPAQPTNYPNLSPSFATPSATPEGDREASSQPAEATEVGCGVDPDVLKIGPS
jgi:hypothetical protein